MAILHGSHGVSRLQCSGLNWTVLDVSTGTDPGPVPSLERALKSFGFYCPDPRHANSEALMLDWTGLGASGREYHVPDSSEAPAGPTAR